MNKRAVIHWSNEDPAKESGEYFENDFTQQFFKKQNLEFTTPGEFTDFCKKNGKYETIDKEELLLHKIVNMTPKFKDFKKELEDPEYKKSFESMITHAIKNGSITLPSPILFYFVKKNLYYGFAGNRRSNLAWALGNTVKYFVIYVK